MFVSQLVSPGGGLPVGFYLCVPPLGVPTLVGVAGSAQCPHTIVSLPPQRGGDWCPPSPYGLGGHRLADL